MSIIANQLVPELSVSSYAKSLDFYARVLGFSVAYDRPEEGFAFWVLDAVQIMIDDIGRGRTWRTGELDFPLGRGINFQIEVKSIDPIFKNLEQNNLPLFLETEEKWYRKNDQEMGSKQFLVQDPDGYLLRFTQDLGERHIKSAS